MFMAMQLAQLGLLVWRESLIESSLGFCVARNHLRGQVADGGRILINCCRVILLDGRLKRLMRGSHLLMQRIGRIGRVGEDGGCLLLLRRRQ